METETERNIHNHTDCMCYTTRHTLCGGPVTPGTQSHLAHLHLARCHTWHAVTPGTLSHLAHSHLAHCHTWHAVTPGTLTPSTLSHLAHWVHGSTPLMPRMLYVAVLQLAWSHAAHVLGHFNPLLVITTWQGGSGDT